VKNLDKICVVCYANYCRSPVAEAILKNQYNDKYQISSAGINPYPEAKMDERSKKFLKDFGYSNTTHIPRKISKEIMSSSIIIFAMDAQVLQMLNRIYPKFRSKIKLFSFKSPKINLRDPYKLCESDYMTVMENIEKISKTIFAQTN
tara:strand:- start:66 stop:506 length:441 start_codon:yes stop_codon:yes gene_type:complete